MPSGAVHPNINTGLWNGFGARSLRPRPGMTKGVGHACPDLRRRGDRCVDRVFPEPSRGQATVIERTGLACAASGKAGGFLALDWCDGTPLQSLARRSFAVHAELP